MLSISPDTIASNGFAGNNSEIVVGISLRDGNFPEKDSPATVDEDMKSVELIMLPGCIRTANTIPTIIETTVESMK